MLLQDEQHVVKWLSQYGALTKTQVIKMLQKPKSAAEKIINNLHKELMISIIAVWVLLKFIESVEPMAHYPAVYPSQLFFLKDNTGYEIVVLYEGEGANLKLLQPEEDLKYIIVVPHISMAKNLKLPKAPCLFATVDYKGSDEPEVNFYKEID